ncbi:MAG: HEAT repeat domain-containing protein [Candidatus Baldrarchaeia archaeon]
MDKITPKLLEILPKLITETEKYSQEHLKNIANILKTQIIEKPEILKDITSLLINELKNENNETRRRAIWLLGEIVKTKPNNYIINKLKELLSDPSEKVRKETAKTLRKINENQKPTTKVKQS